MPFESQSKQRITGEAGDRLNSNYTGGKGILIVGLEGTNFFFFLL